MSFISLAAPALAIFAILAFNYWRHRTADPLRGYRKWLRGMPRQRRAQLEAALKQRLTQN